MKNPSFYILLQFPVLSQLLFHCCCQQQYLNDTVYDCRDVNVTVNAGYVCGGQVLSCASFIAFRSRPLYDTPESIANLLSTDASSIVSINNISSTSQNIPSNQTVIVPINCLCSGNIYQYAIRYTIKPSDTYYFLVRSTFQGLASCQMLQRQNYFSVVNLEVGAQITVPVLCACPTDKQISEEVSQLLVYTVEDGDTINLVSEKYGVDQQSLLAANELSSNATIYALTPILVPLKPSACKLNPHLFYCTCSFYQRYRPESFNSPDCDYLRDSGSRGFPIKLVASIGVGAGAAFLCIFLLGYKLYQCLKQKKERVRNQKLFTQNGGLLLQEKMSSYGNRDNAKLFTAQELERATDNYNQSRFLGQGGFGTVYKGMLLDGSIVAVKKSKDIGRNQIQTFINEVVILSQINHRHIVKLLGCCLETESPLLVYEFIPNGTLSHHIHNHELEENLSWDVRLRIACEVSGAVAYMHSAASIPIFHRDIKTSNILLDHNYNAKVSDFGTSRSVPNDRTHLTTVVQGTFGYIDPEYFQSSQFTDKSDVYSFGVVLVELITGRKPITFSEEHQGQNLVAEFISLMKKDQAYEILDARVVREGREDDLLGIAYLALRCLRLNGKKRPTMREVSAELEALRKTQETLKISEFSVEFPHDRKSAKHGIPLESDEESK